MFFKFGLYMFVCIYLQVIIYNGFYDYNFEWVGLEGVQIVVSMNVGIGLGRYKLIIRFIFIVRICCIGYVREIDFCVILIFLY